MRGLRARFVLQETDAGLLHRISERGSGAAAAQMFPIGTKATICVMPDLSFADGAWPKGVRPGSPIFYEVELHDMSAPAD